MKTAIAFSASALSVLLVAAAPSVQAASLTRSVQVKGSPDQVWAAIGPFCSIKDWHPVIGSCTVDGRSPPVRTLVSKDGKATFVEAQTMRVRHAYGYAIKSSPLPLTLYQSRFSVAGEPGGLTKVTWSSRYSPNAGQEKAAADALAGIYDSGLAAIKAKFAG